MHPKYIYFLVQTYPKIHNNSNLSDSRLSKANDGIPVQNSLIQVHTSQYQDNDMDHSDFG